MTKDLVLRLRYLGVIARIGHREYGFRVEEKDKRIRQVVLTIDNALFLTNQLMFQEAPDLCYQKVLMDLSNDAADAPIRGQVEVTASDIAHYRNSHPTSKSRSKPAARPAEIR